MEFSSSALVCLLLYSDCPKIPLAMSLASGQKLAQYEILEPIGKGGMGEVYRARDTKLRRDVAIKVLPQEFAQDKERLDRFQREARLLAALNHPNIAAIYGVEQHETTHYLVLELVPGETLAERIARGAISVEEARSIASQLNEALEGAHEKAIIARSLTTVLSENKHVPPGLGGSRSRRHRARCARFHERCRVLAQRKREPFTGDETSVAQQSFAG